MKSEFVHVAFILRAGATMKLFLREEEGEDAYLTYC